MIKAEKTATVLKFYRREPQVTVSVDSFFTKHTLSPAFMAALKAVAENCGGTYPDED